MSEPVPNPPSAWASFWQLVVRFQREKMTPWLALRNSIGVALPLAAGVILNQVPAALAVASGALNVAFSDSHEPYVQRVRRMFAASVLVGLGVFSGAISGGNNVTAVMVAGAWAFAAGMLVALSSAAADLGAMSLFTLVVFAAAQQSPARAVASGLLAFAGGLLQLVLAVVLWPVRRYVPERNALAALYRELGRATAAPVPATTSPAASAESTAAQNALASLMGDRSVESERYRMLLSQAERMRLSLLMLARIRARLSRDFAAETEAAQLDRFFAAAGDMLACIATALEAGRPISTCGSSISELQSLAEQMRLSPSSGEVAIMVEDGRHQMDALIGQIRSALDLAAYATAEGLDAFARREHARPWQLRLRGTVATLRANLSLSSAACRHALRLAVCVGLGDAIGRSFELRRSYWLPMTIAILLKPDFSATFSRGVLRLAGTFIGLILATVLSHLLPAWAMAHVLLIGVLMFVMRWVGPANYGILVIGVTALVVFLIGLTGVTAHEVVVARGINTVAGGVIALLAYAVWPTWEKSQAPEVVARMLDAYRDYFRGVKESYMHPESQYAAELDQARLAARLARSNVEASVDRALAEPRTSRETITLLSGMLASSHRLIHAIMALEAGLASSHPVPARAPFAPFSSGVEKTLHSLAAALRGSPLRKKDLPDLREGHHALVQSGDPLTERYALVNVETDRITNSLNTLAEEVLRWMEKA